MTNLFDQFHSTVLFSISFCLYRACFTHLISSNLSCNLCLWYYDQLVHFDKEINANVYRHSLWEYSKRFHCSFEWHLTPHMALSIETCIKQTLQHSPGVSALYRFHCMYIRLYLFIKILRNTFFWLININKTIWFLCGSLIVRFADSKLSAYLILLIAKRKLKDTMMCAV